MRLVQIDSRQHDAVIAGRDNGVAMILPDLDVPEAKLASIVELQLVDPYLEVGDRRVDAALFNDEGVRPGIAGHSLLSGRSDENVVLRSADERVGPL